MLAVALGLQNTSVRRLAVPDLTTTVLTMTITGIAADIRRSSYAVAVRRALSVACMFAGAVVGAVLVLNVNVQTPLAIAAGLTAIVAVGAAAASRHPAAWHDALVTPTPRRADRRTTRLYPGHFQLFFGFSR